LLRVSLNTSRPRCSLSKVVKDTIETLLKRQEAQALAQKEGEAKLEALKKGEDKLTWGALKRVSRMDARLIPPVAAPAVFKMDTAKLPSYAGVELPGTGYALFKLTKVDAGEKLDDARKQAMLTQLGNLSAQEEMRLYLDSLRARYKVEINQSALETKEK
jgi:peptidyl-prolyl cis-trans isomerase D